MEEEEKNESSVGSQIAEKGKESVQNAAKETAQKVTEKAAKKIATKGSLMGPIAHAIMYIAPIIILALIIIGIIIFLLTMPGMLMDKLKSMFEALGNYIAAFYGADTTEQIKDTDIYNTLDYLEQMGYDLKGFGFLTGYVKDLNEVDTDSYDDKDGAQVDPDIGVIRNDSDNIIYAKSDYIFAYIASDNYVYTLANDNIATQQDADNWFKKIGTAILTAWYRVRNAVFGPVFDVLGITNAVGEKWGKGLINLYYEESPKNIGEKGTWVNQGSLWNWDNIKINMSKKTLSIAKNDFLNTNNAIEFSLDGWSGRYGMPIEFLLSVHIATMMPDLSFDMIRNFPTKVNVYLHETSGEATAGYEIGDNRYVSYEELQTELSGFAGRNWFTAVINWFDNWFETSGEVEAARQLGIDVGTRTGKCTCEFTDDKASTDGFKIKQSGDKWVYDEECKDGDGNVIHKSGDNYDGEPIDVGVISSACEYCKKKLEAMTTYLADNNDYNFNAYTPYIANVENHWYRDVYFVSKVDGENKPEGFVDYDYDYEAITGERWTLYETDANGDFVYYVMEEDGTTGEKYTGKVVSGAIQATDKDGNKKTDDEGNPIIERVSNRTEDGRPLVRKAKLIKEEDNIYEDLGWEENGNGKWTAYTKEDTTSGYERLFTDEEVEEKTKDISDETKKQAYKDALEKLYVNLNLTENVVQKGEGLRTETNPTIKKMFLQNRYFKYDGTKDTAEYITSLREKYNNGEYGALSSDKLDKSISVTTVDDKGKSTTNNIKISDVSGIVTLNQDSLNAFSMLENTHTLDSDYIYRDFKELIVELGYYEKEELTDETPRLLQWIVPDIGSGGFPYRPLDKNANEFGTMVHSKGDIDANKKNVLAKIEKQLKAEEPTKGDAPELENVSTPFTSNNSQNLSQISGVQNNSNILSSNNSNINLTNLKGASFVLERVEESGDGYDTVVQSGNVKYIHRYQGGQSYSSTQFFWAGESSTLGRAACGLFSCFNILTGYGYEFDPVKDLSGFRWGATMDAVGALMEEKEVPGQFIDCTDMATLDEALNEGRPAVVLFAANVTDKQGVCWTTQGHFVALAGKDADGNILTLDSAAQGNVKRHNYPGTVEDMQPAIKAKIWIANEPPTGMKKGKDTPYEGYKGNEAVVSPVTGILLDYGTYTEEDKSSITGEKYRQNVDLKYQTVKSEPTEDGEEPKEETVLNPDYDTEKPDLVGYAKILVLDAENYKKLETSSGSHWSGSNSLVATKTKVDDNGKNVVKAIYKDDEDFENKELDAKEKLSGDKWTELNKTVYGYKEFAESYEYGGISGYIVYIDGFECFKPDEEFTEEDLETKSPSTDSELAISMDDFKKVTPSDLNTTEALDDEDKVMPSHYQKDEYHKMASKSATEKLKAVGDVKDQANSTLYTNNMIFIKEGTLLGRTLTDYELIVDYRGQNYEDYRKSKDSTETPGTEDDEEEEEKIIGNYVRTILRDTDDTVVENVEDYMKIDDGTTTKTGDQPYQMQEGDLELLANLLHHEGCEAYFTNILGDSKLGADASRVTGYVVINRALLNYGGHGTTIREQILAPGQYSTAYDVTSETADYCDLCLANAEWCLTYDCSSVISPSSNKPMPRNVVGQSGWCQCSSDLGKFNCWWWVDTTRDGAHTEYTSKGSPFDTFYCQNTSFPEE